MAIQTGPQSTGSSRIFQGVPGVKKNHLPSAPTKVRAKAMTTVWVFPIRRASQETG